MSVISVRQLGKQYRLGLRQHNTLRDQISALFQRRKDSREPETFWALKDVNFDAKEGEVLGVIGRNGAGKSTLLKVLSQITEPTEGEVRIRGRVASLLEVGTGFHPELSGRENVFLNGAILGMNRREIRAKFDEIVAFAEVEKFIDTAVKHYSSGMYVRLAFAVAAHLEPEILIIDEVLAVGDAGFQKKCLGKMDDVSKHGRTVIFVTHQMDMIRALCSRCVLIEKGRIGFDGEPEKAIERYAQNQDAPHAAGSFEAPRKEELPIQLLSGRVLNARGEPQVKFDVFEPVVLELRYLVRKPLVGAVVTFELKRSGAPIFLSFDTDAAPERLGERTPGEFVTLVQLPAPLLKPGQYTVGPDTGIANTRRIHYVEDALRFEVELLSKPSAFVSYAAKRPGLLAVPLTWKTQPAP